MKSLSEAVRRLVVRSLAASATDVRVEVDLDAWALLVRDNGSGFPESMMNALGGHSSRPTTDRGHLDELAAIFALAVHAEVVSRAAGSFETRCLALCRGRVVHEGLSVEQQGCPGTSISLRGLFHQHPVRRTLCSSGLELGQCKQALTELMLLQPSISLTFVDRSRAACLLHLQKGRSRLQCVSDYLGHDPNLLTPVLSHTNPQFLIEGFIVQPPDGHCGRQQQLLLLNGQPVEAPEVAREIDDLFQQLYKPNVHVSGTALALHAHKAANQHAAFVLNISCPHLLSKNSSIALAEAEAIMQCVDCTELAVAVKLAIIAAWQQYLPSSLLAAQLPEQERLTDCGAHPGSHQTTLDGDEAALEQHASQGWMPEQGSAANGELRSEAAAQAARSRALSSTSRARASTRLPSDSCTSSHGSRQSRQAAHSGHLLASRLVRYKRGSDGMALPPSIGPAQLFAPHQQVLALASNKQADDTTPQRQPPRLQFHHGSNRPLARPPSNSSAGGQTWFNSWNAQPLVEAAMAGRHASESMLDLDGLAAGVFAQLRPSKLNRADIQAARALHQVDSKFVPIVCGSMLGMIDQHAADERVRLERLQGELLRQGMQPAGVISQPLKAMVPLSLSVADCKNLEAYQGQVEAWGWRWCWQQDDGIKGAPRPLLSHVPLLWGTTLTATDLKVHLEQLEDTHGAFGVPAGVVRVLNSKACRGAIMFGDKLEVHESQRLLDDLKHTHLCFICAHGRPTTAPIVDLQLLRNATDARRKLWSLAQSGEKPLDAQQGTGAMSSLKHKLQLALA